MIWLPHILGNLDRLWNSKSVSGNAGRMSGKSRGILVSFPAVVSAIISPLCDRVTVHRGMVQFC